MVGVMWKEWEQWGQIADPLIKSSQKSNLFSNEINYIIVFS